MSNKTSSSTKNNYIHCSGRLVGFHKNSLIGYYITVFIRNNQNHQHALVRFSHTIPQIKDLQIGDHVTIVAQLKTISHPQNGHQIQYCKINDMWKSQPMLEQFYDIPIGFAYDKASLTAFFKGRLVSKISKPNKIIEVTVRIDEETIIHLQLTENMRSAEALDKIEIGKIVYISSYIVTTSKNKTTFEMWIINDIATF